MSVLPSPVANSASPPWCMTTPAASCTSNGRMPRMRFDGTHTRPNASGNSLSRDSPPRARPRSRKTGRLDIGVAQSSVKLAFPVADARHIQAPSRQPALPGQADEGNQCIAPDDPRRWRGPSGRMTGSSATTVSAIGSATGFTASAPGTSGLSAFSSFHHTRNRRKDR